MGNFLKINKQEFNEITDIFLDFECVSPSEREQDLWDRASFVLSRIDAILAYMDTYEGAQTVIAKAINSPQDEELQDEAWKAVVPLVEHLRDFFLFSIELQNIVKVLLSALCSDDLSHREHLQEQQALFKQMADILHFTLLFDQMKMSTPAIQNDFSYFRRTHHLLKNADGGPVPEVISKELSMRMSFFYASPTPFLNALSETTEKFVHENPGLPLEKTTDCLSTMASICRVMIEIPRYRDQYSNKGTHMYCLQVMVASIVLYDHIDPDGAFTKRSPINMKSSIKALRNQRGGAQLMDTLRYSTKHLNDDMTSKALRSMLLQ